MTLRRSNPSATAPAINENSMTGSVVDVCTSATMSAEVAMDVIIQATPTPWIRPPKFDAMLANQSARKVPMRNGARVDSGSVAVMF